MSPTLSTHDVVTLEIISPGSPDDQYVLHSQVVLRGEGDRDHGSLSSVKHLCETGRILKEGAQCREYRLRLLLSGETYILSPADHSATMINLNAEPSPEWQHLSKSSLLYKKLTKREKQLLCFLYRGYKQNQIAFVYGISIGTLKSHRKNLYKKMQFHSRKDLVDWCEVHLPEHLEDVRNFSVKRSF